MPSFVTWPTMRTGSARSFATRISVEATLAHWDVPPAMPSIELDEMVCTESAMSRSGWTWSICPRITPRSTSLAR